MNIDDIRSRTTITVPEAGEILGIGRDAAYAAAKVGDIPTLRLGRRLVVPVPALIAMLGGATEAPVHRTPIEELSGALAESRELQATIRKALATVDSRVKQYEELYLKIGGQYQARRRNNEDCPHPALPSSDYCRVHSGARVELRGEAGPELYRP